MFFIHKKLLLEFQPQQSFNCLLMKFRKEPSFILPDIQEIFLFLKLNAHSSYFYHFYFRDIQRLSTKGFQIPVCIPENALFASAT